jgi:hypothetical protein
VCAYCRHSVLLFESERAVRSSSSLLEAIKQILAEPGGAAFYASYLEEVCDPRGDPKWKTLECLRTALRAILQYHKDATMQMMRLQKSASSAEGQRTDGASSPTIEPAPAAGRGLVDRAIREQREILNSLWRCLELLLGLATCERGRGRLRMSAIPRGGSGQNLLNPGASASSLTPVSLSGLTSTALSKTLLTQWTGRSKELEPFAAIVGAVLIEHALTRFAASSPTEEPSRTTTTMHEIVDAWAGECIELVSISHSGQPGSPKNPRRSGGVTLQPLSAALLPSWLEQQDIDALVERLVAMTGRAAAVPGSATLSGLLLAWARTSDPMLITNMSNGSLLRLLEHNAKAYQPTNKTSRLSLRRGSTSDATSRVRIHRSSSKDASTMDRDSDQLEAIVAGIAKLAWQLPISMDALEMFGNLLKHRSDEMNFSQEEGVDAARSGGCGASTRAWSDQLPDLQSLSYL